MPHLKLGTRGSPLALAQARETCHRLREAHGWDVDAVEIVVIKTTGDMILDRALSTAGGKGLFTKELDTALIEGAIDYAVHSAKDMPTRLPDAIAIAGYLPREDVRDALIARNGAQTFADLPAGARLGSASLRRQALARRLRPDIDVSLLRGNVGTRLAKVAEGEFDATLLAYAGLKRLGLADRATGLLDIDSFPPAVGQGAIAITVRAGDTGSRDHLSAICDDMTAIALAAERAFLTVLDGSCRTPIAGHGRITADGLTFHGMVLRADGAEVFEARGTSDPAGAAALGQSCGRDILDRLPPGILAAA